MLQGKFRLDMKMLRMEKHRTRLRGEVQSLHRKNNGEGRAHPALGHKDPSSPVIPRFQQQETAETLCLDFILSLWNGRLLKLHYTSVSFSFDLRQFGLSSLNKQAFFLCSGVAPLTMRVSSIKQIAKSLGNTVPLP